MASLYKRDNSPYWYIKYRDPKTGTIVREPTAYRHGVEEMTKKAKLLVAQKTTEERTLNPAKQDECWSVWVPDWMKKYYTEYSQFTYEGRVGMWKTLETFLTQAKVEMPRQLTRDHCDQYLLWRTWTNPPKEPRCEFRAGRSTAREELGFLKMVVDAAITKGYFALGQNPCCRLKIRAVKRKQKPALSAEMLTHIEGLITAEKDDEYRTFLGNSHLIARYHGCRLGETYLNPQEQVEVLQRDDQDNITDARITFFAKGNKIHTVKLHPKLYALFDDLISRGVTETYSSRFGGSLQAQKYAAYVWHMRLKKSGAAAKWPGLCFHSHRVNAATVFARKGISERQAMRYLGHASSTVHSVYIRLQAEDLPQCTAALE